MDERKEKQNKKRLIRAAVCLTMIFVLSLTVFAWFTNEKKLDTITKVKSPTALEIGAGNKEDSKNIDLGEIDVTKGASADYVFCVFSDSTVGNYKLQLAHTTNIPFTYTIYKANDVTSNGSGDVTYTAENGTSSYYYSKNGNAIEGNYLNRDTTDTTIANKTYHDKTYGTYSNVQKNAEPLYWQSGEITHSGISANKFVDYYILELTWNTNDVSNNKETDMVYITANMTNMTNVTN